MNKELLLEEIQQIKRKLGDDSVSIRDIFTFLSYEAPGRYTIQDVKEAVSQ